MTRELRVICPGSGDLYSDNATITLQERPHRPWGIAVLLRNLARRRRLPEPQ